MSTDATPTADTAGTVERRVVVATEIGLHARPAATFCKAAAKQQARVTLITASGDSADARSMLAVLGLGVRGGQEVTLSADATADGAQASVDALADLLATDLDAA